jgi:hypothetical protein
MTVEINRQSRRSFLRSLLLATPVMMAAPAVWASGPRIAPLADLRFLTSVMPIRRRHEWTMIPPNPARLRLALPNRYSRITLHHTGTDVVTATSEPAVMRCLDSVLGGHLHRNFGDVGYHFLIDYAGRIWEGRSLAYWGAHVANHNEQNIGIVLLGNFERQRPSRAQLQSMEHLTHLLRHHYSIRRGQVFGHIDLGRTLCPGKHLYPRVQRLNQLA